MQEGDTELGGLQIPHGNNVNPPTPTPGPQPDSSAAPQNPQSIQSDQSVSHLTSQTFILNNTTNEETQLNSIASQPASPPQQTPPPQFFQQFSTQPTPSNTGDVIFGDTLPRQPRKGLIVTIITCLILFITAGISVYLIVRNNNNASTDSNADTKTLLNRYSNYLLYQTDSDASINNDIMWSNDKILENLNIDGDVKAAYFTNLVHLFDELSGEIKKKYNTQSEALSLDNQNENPEDDEGALISNLISNTDYSLETLKTYSELNRYSVVDMVEIFLSQGGEKLIEIVKNSYNNIVSSEYSQIREYTELEIKIATLVSEVYTEYTKAGCISNNEVTKNCLGNTAFPETHINNKALLNNYVSALDDVNYHITNDVVILSRELYKEMNAMEENE